MTMLESIYRVDLRMLLWCRNQHARPLLLSFVRAISKSGDGYVHLLLPLLIVIISPERGGPFFLLAMQAFAFERSLYFILKNTLKRRRPPEVVPDFTSIVTASDKFSFPSGHTMAAFLLAGLFLGEFGWIALALYPWAMCVGLSRVVLGVHFPTDIAAGALLGSSVAYFVTS